MCERDATRVGGTEGLETLEIRCAWKVWIGLVEGIGRVGVGGGV